MLIHQDYPIVQCSWTTDNLFKSIFKVLIWSITTEVNKECVKIQYAVI